MPTYRMRLSNVIRGLSSWPERIMRKEVPYRMVTMMEMLTQQAEAAPFTVVLYKKGGKIHGAGKEEGREFLTPSSRR